MNAGQKATKYIGMFIGVLLAICIIGAIARAGLELIRVFTGGSNESIAEFAEDYDEKITSLDLRNDLGEVRLVAGDTWRVEASDVSKSFKSQVTGGKLVICNDSKNWFSLFHWGNRSPRVTVYMPEEELDSILLDTGAGAVYADAALNARSVRLNGGAGEIRLSSVKADNLKIDLGVGKTDIQGADVGGLDLDGGVGAFYFTGRISGDADIDSGVGEVRLNLTGSKSEDFNYNIDNGVGEIRVGGQSFGDGKFANGGALQTMKIDGGVGAVIVNFED